eukprot:Em0018g633a
MRLQAGMCNITICILNTGYIISRFRSPRYNSCTHSPTPSHASHAWIYPINCSLDDIIVTFPITCQCCSAAVTPGSSLRAAQSPRLSATTPQQQPHLPPPARFL